VRQGLRNGWSRWAPSGSHERPWRLERPEGVLEMLAIGATLGGHNISSLSSGTPVTRSDVCLTSRQSGHRSARFLPIPSLAPGKVAVVEQHG